jgi:hypothetical protein
MFVVRHVVGFFLSAFTGALGVGPLCETRPHDCGEQCAGDWTFSVQKERNTHTQPQTCKLVP